MRRSKFFLLLSLLLSTITFAGGDNLTTCLSGKFPDLCDHSLLTVKQAKQVQQAEKLANLKTCYSGKFPSLCRRELLSTSELDKTSQAEKGENLKTCLKGNLTALCQHDLLNEDERRRVSAAEKKVNFRICISGRFTALCRKDLLTLEELKKVSRSEERVNKTVKKSSPSMVRNNLSSRGTNDCESGHWVTEVMNSGELVQLEDGSLWKISPVDTVDTSLWLPTTDIVSCSDKLINTEDGETAEAQRIR